MKLLIRFVLIIQILLVSHTIALASVALEKALFHSKSLSVLETAILFSKEVDKEFSSKQIREQFRQMVEDIRPVIEKESRPKKQLTILKEFIYEKWGFKVPSQVGGNNNLGYYDSLLRFAEESPEQIYKDSFLVPVIQNRQGNCLGLTSLYLALAEALDLPIYPVFAPYHIFPRYDDGTVKINIEATAFGMIFPDQFYIRVAHLSKEAIEQKSYLATLEPKDLFSGYYLALGSYYSGQGLIKKAKSAFQSSLKVSPKLALAYTNLAFVYSYYKMSSDWNSVTDTAMELDPNFIGSYLMMAQAYAREGNYPKAITVMKKAVEKHPDVAHAYALLAEYYLVEGDFKKSIKGIEKAIHIAPWEGSFYATLAKIHYYKKDYPKSLKSAKKAQSMGAKDLTYLYLAKKKMG